uniref:Uncharacterized protein n=2 Tax=Oryza sativa subsp. japonica TaxID=39947 RepID=Q53MI4_ORYSJ|nr:hypothetical protein LOC_Os11g18850 [Oryza sativa Japonica Group]ABA92720.1 hypothetical protein LOC_Os11g18850 [Oryza sativa Japonica Group]
MENLTEEQQYWLEGQAHQFQHGGAHQYRLMKADCKKQRKIGFGVIKTRNFEAGVPICFEEKIEYTGLGELLSSYAGPNLDEMRACQSV